MLKELETKLNYSFTDKESFKKFIQKDHIYIGHNIIEFDAPQLKRIWDIDLGETIDTLILSRLYNPKLEDGHSLESWGRRLHFPKGDFSDFSKYSAEMHKYCENDVELTARVYTALMDRVGKWTKAIKLEHEVALALRDARKHGFYFDVNTAVDLRKELEVERNKLDEIIQLAYPPTTTGKRVIKEVPFNPNSAKQVIDKLWEAGWKPIEKTDGHKEWSKIGKPIDHVDYYKKQERFERYGWKLNEVNMATLPEGAPEAAKSILKRTIFETRIRKLDEWMNLVQDDGAIHGEVIGLGTWTHRMSHRNPNLANISAKKSIKYHTEELKTLATSLGGRMRALWLARPGKVLVGTDAEGIQLRVLAHYMNDKEFIDAVCSGTKEEGTDPHTLNKHKLGDICSSRDNAKTFIYAFLLGAGDGKVGEIFNISRVKGKVVKEEFIEAYPGLKRLKTERIPSDAYRGYTVGFDSRQIKCESEHLMMAAYLQAGEAIIMKVAVVHAVKKIGHIAKLINVVHDEMIFECDEKNAEEVRIACEWAIEQAGKDLKLRCPMKGEGKYGKTWLDVH